MKGEAYKGSRVGHIQRTSLLTHLTLRSLRPAMASFDFESGRQFETDPISGQIFYREPIDGSYSPWTPLESSDYHPLQPAAHNVMSPSGVSSEY